jgi:cytochrome c553
MDWVRFGGTRRVITLGLCAMVLVGGSLAGVQAQEPVTEEEYGPLMTEIRFTIGDALQHVDSFYWPELGEDLDKLLPMLRQVEAFWTERGNDDATSKAQDLMGSFDALNQAAIGQSQGDARTAIQDMRATCAPCHQAHREETSDGFRIKAGS